MARLAWIGRGGEAGELRTPRTAYRLVLGLCPLAVLLLATFLVGSPAASAAGSGQWLYYERNIKGFEQTSFREIWRARPNGGERACVLPAAEQHIEHFDVSADGRYLVRVETRYWHGEKNRLYLYDLVSGTRRPLTPPKWNVYLPIFSPDGGQIAFIREPKPLEFGRGRLYRMNRDGTRKRPVAADRGVFTLSWKHNGKEIAYVDNRFVRVVNLRTGKRRWFVGYTGMNGYAAPVVEELGPWTEKRGLYYTSSFIYDPDFGGTEKNEPHPGIYRVEKRVKIKGAPVRTFGSRFSRRGGFLPGWLAVLSDERTVLGNHKRGISRLFPGRIESLGLSRGQNPHLSRLPSRTLSCAAAAELFRPSPDVTRLEVPYPSPAALRAERLAEPPVRRSSGSPPPSG